MEANLSPEISPPQASQKAEALARKENLEDKRVETESVPKDKEKDPFKDAREGQARILEAVLAEKHLYYDQDAFNNQFQEDNKRFLTIDVVEPTIDAEGNTIDMRRRFFKAYLPQQNPENDATIKEHFKRQVRVQEFLDERTDFPVTEILDSNTHEESGPLYSLVNWYDAGEGVGFLREVGDQEKLTDEHAQIAIVAIRSLHNQKEIPSELISVLDKRVAYRDFDGFRENLRQIFDRRVVGAGSFHSPEGSSYAELMARKTGSVDFTGQVDALIDSSRAVIEEYQGKGVHLVHGDFAPNNIFLGDGYNSDKFIGLDFEWAGGSENEVLAAIYDFGNLHARSWNNPAFQDALSREMIASYTAHGREDVGRAVVSLGILRSHMNLGSYFENVPPDKEVDVEIKCRQETEKALPKAWTAVGLEVPFQVAENPS